VSRRRVLDLQTSLPEGGEWRLPSEVFTHFDGRRWSNPPPTPPVGAAPGMGATVLRPTPVPARAGPVLEGIGAWFEVAPVSAEVVELRVTQAEVGSWPLLVPRGSVAVTADAWLLGIDAHGLIRRPQGDALRLYGAVWSATPAVTLRAPEPTQIAEALELPPHLDPRLRALARELATSPAPVRRIEATVGHLRSGYRYTFRPGAFRTGDPLAEFLFEKKAGYCEYFASAAVILLRVQGVPARFVKGLSVGLQTDQGGGLHVVRESDAHAWAEAWVPGSGWVEIDPTPPGQLMESRSRPSAFSRLAERLRASLASAWTRFTLRGPVAFGRWLAGRLAAALEQAVGSPLAWLVLLGLALGRFVLRVVRARLRRAPPPPRDVAEHVVPADLRALVRELEQRWTGAGLARPAGRGLLEHAHRVLGATPPPPPVLAAAGPRIVEAYYRARFGGVALSATERIALREALQTVAPSRTREPPRA
jgi:transglutaminase-like putative cysteine protease